jgi:hypothetical protein
MKTASITTRSVAVTTVFGIEDDDAAADRAALSLGC